MPTDLFLKNKLFYGGYASGQNKSSAAPGPAAVLADPLVAALAEVQRLAALRAEPLLPGLLDIPVAEGRYALVFG